MLPKLKALFSSAPAPSAEAYVSIVTAARRPELFTQIGLPDTLDGRFDSILLHLFLVQHRLKDLPEAVDFCRALNEHFISDMDRGLREMGVTDTGVGKRVKVMAQALIGRLKTYRDTFDNPETFRDALKRNAFGTSLPTVQQLDALDTYARSVANTLTAQSAEALLSGKVKF